MSRNYYSEIHLHLVWHTKESLPLLTPDVEPLAHRHIKQKFIDTECVFIHEIGGTETHVHTVVTIQPTVMISELIGQIKGFSSHEVNRQNALRDKALQWQTGYGVVSFGTRQLEWVKQYVRDQREHHGRAAVVDRLERITSPEA